MFPLFKEKNNTIPKRALKKTIKFRHQKTEYLNKFNHTIENQKNISLNNFKNNETSYYYRISTLATESNEIHKTINKTIIGHRILKNKNKNNNLNELFKNTLLSTKKILRPRTTSKTKFNKNKFKNENMNNIHNHYNRNARKNKLNEVPLTFIESMRLNIEQNLTKADLFFKQEHKKKIRENPDLKYKLRYIKNQEKKKEQLEKINQFKIWKKYLQSNKKEGDINKLNAYHSKLLLHENNQYFNFYKPIIDKSKFNPKFRLLPENYEEEKPKIFDFHIVNNIFGKYLEEDKGNSTEKIKFKKNEKIPKKIIYKRFKIIIKKCAIEFRNTVIPLKEYLKYIGASKNIIKYLFNKDYIKLIKLMKREEGIDIIQKEKDIIKEITRDKLLIHTIDFYGQNILFLSVKYKLFKSLSKIIQFGSNINLQDFKGRTALHFAAKYNDITSVSILLYYLADPSIQDNNGETPLDYNSNNGHDGYMIKELLIRSKIIRKLNKYRSWKEYDIYIRRGIQYYLIQNLPKEKYLLIFSYIDNANLYYS